MGLLGDLFGGMRMRFPVRGTAQVVSTTGYTGEGSVYQNCRMQLVVSGDGVAPTAVQHSGLAPRSKWPCAGMTLPVTVDRADPRRMKIEWDRVEAHGDGAARQAEAMAAMMRGEPAPGGPAGGGAGSFGGAQVINLSGGDLSALSDEQKAKLRMLGIDPAALAASPQMVAAPETPVKGDEKLERLERLARLRTDGMLSPAEFEQEKRRILEG